MKLNCYTCVHELHKYWRALFRGAGAAAGDRAALRAFDRRGGGHGPRRDHDRDRGQAGARGERRQCCGARGHGDRPARSDLPARTHRQPHASHVSDQRDPVRRSVSLEHRGFISIDSSMPKYKFVRRLTDNDHQFVAGEVPSAMTRWMTSRRFSSRLLIVRSPSMAAPLKWPERGHFYSAHKGLLYTASTFMFRVMNLMVNPEQTTWSVVGSHH